MSLSCLSSVIEVFDFRAIASPFIFKQKFGGVCDFLIGEVKQTFYTIKALTVSIYQSILSGSQSAVYYRWSVIFKIDRYRWFSIGMP